MPAVTAAEPIRTLLFSTLYPSAQRPLHGIFVETRLRELLKTGAVQTTVVAPVPWFPWGDARWGDYARFALTPAREVRHGVTVLHPRYLLPPKVGMAPAPLLLALGALGAVRRLLRDGAGFDLIDAHYYYPDGVAAAMLGHWLGKPVVVTARGSDVNLISQYALPRRQLQWAARQAGASVGVSAALVERMRALGFDVGRLHVMRNGVDLQQFDVLPTAAMRQALGLVGGPLLLSVGNLVAHKGHGLVIEALALLRADPAWSDARLLVVGAGPDAAQFKAQAQALGVAEAVRWVGQVPNADLKHWYSAADVLVLASSREGWPNVLLEAMACGTPVVASDVGGVREIVQTSPAGRVVAQRTPAAFAAALTDLLANPPARTTVRGHAARFGWDSTSQDQLRLFRHLTSGAPLDMH